MLAEVGYADTLLARELPDGKLILIDGHLRGESTPGTNVPVLVLDVTEEEADKILLTLAQAFYCERIRGKRPTWGGCGGTAGGFGWSGRIPPYGVSYAAKNEYLNRGDRASEFRSESKAILRKNRTSTLDLMARLRLAAGQQAHEEGKREQPEPENQAAIETTATEVGDEPNT